MYEAAIHRYLIVLTGHLSKLEKSLGVAVNDRKKYSRILKGKLRKTLKENRSFLRNEKYYDWYYELAHPKLSWLKWTVKGIANKFRRTGHE